MLGNAAFYKIIKVMFSYSKYLVFNDFIYLKF